MVKGHLYGRILLGNMKVNGKMENEMDLGNQFGLNQIKSMKGNIRMIKKMDLEQKFTRMEVNMLEISLITWSAASIEIQDPSHMRRNWYRWYNRFQTPVRGGTVRLLVPWRKIEVVLKKVC